jgi:hypothetical protein
MSSPRMALMRPPFVVMVILFFMTRTNNVYAFSCSAPLGLHLRTTYATSSRRIRAAAGIRGATCQLFPVEKLFGGKRNADYHEDQVRYHEVLPPAFPFWSVAERSAVVLRQKRRAPPFIRFRGVLLQERLAYHRAELLKIREDRSASIERQKARAGSSCRAYFHASWPGR